MKINHSITSCLVCFLFFTFSACQMEKESESDVLFTASVNGESWKFFDMQVTREADGMTIKGLGYLDGERGAKGLNLTIKLINIQENNQLTPPFEAYFTPGTQEHAVVATVKPTDSSTAYDTELDTNANGLLKITKLEEGKISGTFNFVAKDEAGNALVVENGNFTDVNVAGE